MAKPTPYQEKQLSRALETEEGRLRIGMAIHQRLRDFRRIRYALGVQQLPDQVLHEHGLKTNDEIAREILEKKDG